MPFLFPRAVVVKTIRADTGVGAVDERDTGGRRLLIVHLVRDPRAVIHSQINTFNVAHKYRRYFSPQAEPIEDFGAAAEVTARRSLEPSTKSKDKSHFIEAWLRIAKFR